MAVTETNRYVAPVVDGKVNISESSQDTGKKSGSILGKDDFLLLLTTQMKYQDPLNPQSDPEFVAQLAQFSALEEMQNLNATTMNSQAFGLVGKEVVIQTDEKEIEGAVDFVTVSGGKTMLSVDGTLYSIDDLSKVYDENYLISTYLPSVEAAAVTYSHYEPKDVSLKIDLGSNGYQASAFGVAIMKGDGSEQQVINKDYLTFKNNTLVIDKKAFESLPEGEYRLVFVFDDPLQTVAADKVTIKIKGPVLTETKPAEDGDDKVDETEEGDDVADAPPEETGDTTN